MRPSISPHEKRHDFRFSGEDRLYTDHLGRRVLADVEGFGLFRIEPRSQIPSVSVDDAPVDMFEGSYDSSLLVATPEPGHFRVEVAAGRKEPLTGSVETGEKFDGCGWILSSDGPFRIDDEHESHEGRHPVPLFATPFLRHASGSGLKVIRAAERCEPIDAFDVTDEQACRDRGWKVQNASKLFQLSSRFPDGTPHGAELLSHLNSASWRVPLPKECLGLIVRKLYDAFHGRQRARVLVDGRFAGWWYEPLEDRASRWRWARFGIDAALLQGRSEVTITIDPPAGAPLWSVARIEVDGVVSGTVGKWVGG
jgi:hypothetical protein